MAVKDRGSANEISLSCIVRTLVWVTLLVAAASDACDSECQLQQRILSSGQRQ